MFAVTVILLFILYITVYYYKNAYKKPHNFPPGPPSLPVYGALWIVLAHEFKNLGKAFIKLGKKYHTKVVGLYLGSVPTVVLNDPKDIKEMFSREEFEGRMDVFLFRFRSYWKKLGIIATDGSFWQVQRRFTQRHLRDYGFGRRCEDLEGLLASEIKEMIDMRLNGPKYPAENDIVKGDSVLFAYFIAVPFINGMCHMLSCMTLPRKDYSVLWGLSEASIKFQQCSNDIGGALSLTPWLKDLMPKYFGYTNLKEGHQHLLHFFEKLVKEVLETHDENNERHYLDQFITKMKQEQREGKKSTFSVDQLVVTCTDYMFPAASAVQSVLNMFVDRLLVMPDVQAKIHEEIDRVVGRERLPTLDDKPNMPYTEACIREAMRFDTLVVLGLAHRAMKDTTIAGYNVPEGTMMSPNLQLLHLSKDVWGDPENFRPERFIVDGKISLANDKSMPFGGGRRLCAGETYARQSMFQVLTGLLQTFHISTHDGKPHRPAERIQGISTTIPPFWVKLTPRS